MAVRAGYYRHRMHIAKDSGERNRFGGSAGKRELVQSPWCKVRTISDNENNGEQTVDQLLLEFEMRYSRSIENPDASMYVIYRDVEYDIISCINKDMRNEKLIILGKKRR